MTAWLDAHPTVRTAVRVFVYAFLAVFIPSLLGFLGDVQEWANGTDQNFPAVSAVAKAAVAAVSGAIASLLAVIWNKLPQTPTSEYTEGT